MPTDGKIKTYKKEIEKESKLEKKKSSSHCLQMT